MKEWRATFSVPIFDAQVMVIVSDDIEYSKRIVRRCVRDNMQPDNFSQSGAALMYSYPYYAVLWGRVEFDTGVLGHEVGHLCRQLLSDVGHKLKVENDEILALLEEWITRKLSKLLLKNGRLIR